MKKDLILGFFSRMRKYLLKKCVGLRRLPMVDTSNSIYNSIYVIKIEKKIKKVRKKKEMRF